MAERQAPGRPFLRLARPRSEPPYWAVSPGSVIDWSVIVGAENRRVVSGIAWPIVGAVEGSVVAAPAPAVSSPRTTIAPAAPAVSAPRSAVAPAAPAAADSDADAPTAAPAAAPTPAAAPAPAAPAMGLRWGFLVHFAAAVR